METAVFEVSANGTRITLTDGTIWEPVSEREMKKATQCPLASAIDRALLPNGEVLLTCHGSRSDEEIRVREVDDDGTDVLLYA